MRDRNPPRRGFGVRSALLTGASIAVIGLGGPVLAQTASLLRGAAGLGTPAVTTTTAQTPSPTVTPNLGAMTSASMRALQNAARLTNATGAALQANTAARAAAAALAQTVPNGLGVGGLQVAPGVVAGTTDATGLKTWIGADLPTQVRDAASATVTIKQTAERAILSWQTFNIGRDTTLVFDQSIGGAAQPDWIVLNRIVGQINPATGRRDGTAPAPSQILGSIKAPGVVLVLNQNGVLFDGTSQVNTRGLIATSLEIGRGTTALRTDITARTIAERNTSFLQDGLLGYAETAGNITNFAPNLSTFDQVYVTQLDADGNPLLDAFGRPVPAIPDPALEGRVGVAAGAQLTTAERGFIILAAPVVENAGQLTASSGQVVLASTRSLILRPSTGEANSLDPDLRGYVIASGAALPSAGAGLLRNTATGLISAARGNITLASDGGAVVQAGVLSSTTSVSQNGSITIAGADIRLAATSVIGITPDTGGETIPQSPDALAAFKTSQIDIMVTPFDRTITTPGITLASGALIYAPSADVAIGDRPGAVGAGLSPNILIDSGAVIDVGGIKDLQLAASRNSIKIAPVKRNELRDTPNYREPLSQAEIDAGSDRFTLNGTTLFLDPRLSGVRSDGVAWVGSPLIEAGSIAQQIGITAAEAMTTGGTITLGTQFPTAASLLAGGSIARVIVRPGAVLDVSGGWVSYAAGEVATSRLLTRSGQVVDIGAADPNEDYIALVSGFTETQERWGDQGVSTFSNPAFTGSRFEPGYTEGRDAGAIIVKGAAPELGGSIFAQAFAGTRQLADAVTGTATPTLFGDQRRLQASAGQLPAGGFLNVQALAATVPTPAGQPVVNPYGGGDILVATAGTPAQAGRITLSDTALNAAGLGQLSLATSGAVTLAAGSNLRLADGGVLDIAAGRTVTINGTVTIASGHVGIETLALIGADANGSIFRSDDDVPALLASNAAVPRPFDIIVNGRISVRGRVVNDFTVTDGALLGGAWIDGGSISLTGASRAALRLVDPISGDLLPDAVDISGSIRINSSARLDVSAGLYVDRLGNFDLSGLGGDVSLSNDTAYFQVSSTPSGGQVIGNTPTIRFTKDITQRIESAISPSIIRAEVQIADGTIIGHGFAGGGTFALTTPDFAFGAAGSAGTATALPLDFFSRSGFGSYDIKVYKTQFFTGLFANDAGGASALLTTNRVRINAGQTLDLSLSRFPILFSGPTTDLLRGIANDIDLHSLLTPGVPVDAWDQRPVSLAFSGLTELEVAAGGRITGSDTSALTVAKLINNGNIRLPGGTITQAEVLPTSYAFDNLALGRSSLDQVFGAVDGNGRFDENAPNALGITLNGNILSNANLVAGFSGARLVYLTGVLGQGEGVRLGAGSVTDLSGVSIRNPRAAPRGVGSTSVIADGRIITGGTLQSLGQQQRAVGSFGTPDFLSSPLAAILDGSVNTSSNRANRTLTALPGARIDLSGASDAYDQLTAGTGLGGGDRYSPRPVWSAGGALTLEGGGSIEGASVAARGGSTGGALAADGTALASEGGILTWAAPRLRQIGIAGLDILGADDVAAAGFDTLVALGSVASEGNVTLSLGRAFRLESRRYFGAGSFEAELATNIGGTGNLDISAPYIQLGSQLQGRSVLSTAAPGSFTARFRGGAIDILGAVAFDPAFASVTLAATGDLRLIGVRPPVKLFGNGSDVPESLGGALLARGRLTLDATRVYATTGTGAGSTGTLANPQPAAPFLIASTLQPAANSAAVLRITNSAGAAAVTPYSAGANLLLQAASIEQAGNLLLPLGTLTLGGGAPLTLGSITIPTTDRLTLGAASVTSVSAGGLSIPYGTTTDQIEYFFTPTSDARLLAPPAGVLTLAGGDVSVPAGAKVDLRGGGDIYAYEFASGTGGSRDVLDRFNADAFSSSNGLQFPDGRQVYAIVPGLSAAAVAAYDPIYSSDYGLGSDVGRRVYLEAGAAGLPAGWYTLLPAKYAQLPGGVRIVESLASFNGQAGAASTLRDGSVQVAGYYGVAGTSIAEATRRIYTVESQAVFRQFSTINLTSGSASFAALAARGGNPPPRLPADAGRLVVNPLVALRLDAPLLSAPANGGRGAQVDIAGAMIEIADSTAIAAAPGAILLTSATLNNLGAASLLIGGRRTDNVDGTTNLDLTAQSILVRNSAAAPLSAPEIILATDSPLSTVTLPNGTDALRAGASSITLADGATITATGTLGDTRTGDYIITGSAGGMTAVGSLVRVANGPERLVQRVSSALEAPGERATLTIGSASLTGTTVALESIANFSLADNVTFTADALSVAARQVTFGTVANPPLGLVISPAAAARLAAAGRLTVRTPNAILFNGGNYAFRDLTLSAPGLRLVDIDGGAVTLTTGRLQIANPGTATGACTAAGQNACGTGTLAITATSLNFGSGTLRTYGFGGGVSIRAPLGTTYAGAAVLDVGPAPFSLVTPYLGDAAATVDPRNAPVLPSLTITTSGDVAISRAAGTSASVAAGLPGSNLIITGNRITVTDTNLRATAGRLELASATSLAINGSSTLSAPGYSAVFGDSADRVTIAAPGGTLALTAAAGDLTLGTGTTLSVGGGRGDAGAIQLAAARGTLTLGSSIDTAAPTGRASIRFDSGGDFGLAAFVAANGSKFTGDWAIRTGAGNLDLNAGQAITATSLTLVADGGAVNVAGAIDTSGVNGGAIGLYGNSGVTLAATGSLTARASGYASDDSRRAQGGDVSIGIESGAITLAAGSRIDAGVTNTSNRFIASVRKDPLTFADVNVFTFAAADTGGNVLLRAPVVADTVAITAAGSIAGASAITVEGYRRFDLAAAAADPTLTGVTIANGVATLDVNAAATGRRNLLSGSGAGTVVDFVQSFNIAASPGLATLARADNYIARPGVELAYTGDIVLASNWNLGAGTVDTVGAQAAGLLVPAGPNASKLAIAPGSEGDIFSRFTTLTYRVGGLVTGAAPIVTLRAGGQLDLRGSVSDGFFAFRDQTDPSYIAYALGGGDRVYNPMFQFTCVDDNCGGADDWFFDPTLRSPNTSRLNINLNRVFFGPDVDVPVYAPYSALANAPGALGAGTGGSGDPIGTAQLFPLVDGRAVASSSYRFTGGALAVTRSDAATVWSADPLRVDPGATGGVTVSGERSYQLAATRTTAFDGSVYVDFRTDGQQLPATGFLDYFIRNVVGEDTPLTAYTSLNFSDAPVAVRNFIRDNVAGYFNGISDPFAPQSYQLFTVAGRGQSILSTTVERAIGFLTYLDSNATLSGTSLTDFIASGSSNFAKPPNTTLPALPAGSRTVYTRSLVRTGTGSIAIAAARDIDLLATSQAVFRNSSNANASASSVNAAQVGGTAVYSAGHVVTPGIVTGTTATGQVISADSRTLALPATLMPDSSGQVIPDFLAAFRGGSATGILAQAPAYADGGGSVSLVAGRDVRGRRDAWDEINGGGAATIAGTSNQRWRTGSVGATVNIRVNPQLFRSGVAALGGGDVSVIAGRDVSDLTVAADSSITTGASGATLAQVNYGGGDVTVAAGRDLAGGRIDVALGSGSITAGGNVRSTGQLRVGDVATGDPRGALIDNALRLQLSDARVSVAARGAVTIGGILALGTAVTNGTTSNDPQGSLLSNLNARGFYSEGAGVSLAANSSVTFNSIDTQIIGQPAVTVLPGSFAATALTGDLSLDTSPAIANILQLLPSPRGQLSLFAGGTINQATIVVDDGDVGLLPGAFSIFALDPGDATLLAGRSFGFPALGPDVSDATLRTYHSARLIHQGDAQPIRIAAGNDITRLTLSVPKAARISAGRDITNMIFFGQNLATGDTTRIVAGRDIVGTTRLVPTPTGERAADGTPLTALRSTPQGNSFRLGGPGNFVLEAGRDAGPFLTSSTVGSGSGALDFAGGIITTGADDNPYLPTVGARLTLAFGVAAGANYDAIRDFYVDPANAANLEGDLFEQITDAAGNKTPDRTRPIYAAILVNWMLANAPGALPPGSTAGNLTAAVAYAAFKTLPTLSQRNFLLENVFFNELAVTARPDGPSFLQYGRGYRAIDRLFPAGLGYTANDLTGGGGAGRQVTTGNLDLRLATVQTARGGNLNILGPGGRILGGSVVRSSAQADRRGSDAPPDTAGLYSGKRREDVRFALNAARVTAIPIAAEGLLTLNGGAARVFVDDDFVLNQSRLFTNAGGDITVWSSNGDVAAGQGPKSAANFPPIIVRFNPNGAAAIDSSGAVSGAGIGAFLAKPGDPESNISLIAPLGTVDAGDAGVRATGNIFVAAARVANADNFKATGSISGTGAAVAVDVGAQVAGSGATAALNAALNDLNPTAAANGLLPTRITVEVIGFGDDNN